MHQSLILILEDDQDRVTRFRAALKTLAPRAKILVWRDARKMIAEVDRHLPEACLVSLDHDLYPESDGAPDPGDGLEVAKHLAGRKVRCPVIIHTSNADRSRMMAGEFELSSCRCRTVAPLGSDWIETYWLKVVRSLLEP